MHYSYQEFLQDLAIGREIEFIYKEEGYYIGRGMFWKFNEPTSEVICNHKEDLLQKVRFNGKSIKDIWTDIDVVTIY